MPGCSSGRPEKQPRQRPTAVDPSTPASWLRPPSPQARGLCLQSLGTGRPSPVLAAKRWLMCLWAAVCEVVLAVKRDAGTR